MRHEPLRRRAASGPLRLPVRPSRWWPSVIATLLVLGVAAPPAPAGVHDCDSSAHIRYRLSAVATILNVRDMSCRSARRAVRRHGRSTGSAPYQYGGRFRLGTWSCTNYFADYEHYKARCVRGHRAFRVDYGA